MTVFLVAVAVVDDDNDDDGLVAAAAVRAGGQVGCFTFNNSFLCFFADGWNIPVIRRSAATFTLKCDSRKHVDKSLSVKAEVSPPTKSLNCLSFSITDADLEEEVDDDDEEEDLTMMISIYCLFHFLPSENNNNNNGDKKNRSSTCSFNSSTMIIIHRQ